MRLGGLQLALASYALTQVKRVRGGAGALAGNHVIFERDGGGYVVLAHLHVAGRSGWRRASSSRSVKKWAGAATPATRPSRTSTSRSWTHRTLHRAGPAPRLPGLSGVAPSRWVADRGGARDPDEGEVVEAL